MTWPIVNLAMFLLDTTQFLILNLNLFLQLKLFCTKVNIFSEHDDDDGCDNDGNDDDGNYGDGNDDDGNDDDGYDGD